MCLYPKLIKNKKWVPNKKNGGEPPTMKDPRTAWVPVGCQKCMECKKQKARAWSIRLQEEIKTDRTGKFVTLTFSNESIYNIINGLDTAGERTGKTEPIKGLDGYELDNEIAKIAVRRFLERWRRKYGKSIKHWLITELGQEKKKGMHQGTENIHLHGIIFTDKPEAIRERWQYGFVYIGDYVSNRTINYCVKYYTKTDLLHREYQAKILTSAGIGKNYINRLDKERNKFNGEKTKETYKTDDGKEINLPTYWRNKIYTDEEKEQLWIQKLDKNERWVDGIKIDTSKGMDEYYKALETARAKNERLGYGNDAINWDRKEYERTRRNMLVKKRLDKVLQNVLHLEDGKQED